MTKNKTTLTRGRLEIFTVAMHVFNDDRQRTIRVWLPDGYDKNNKVIKYPVLYMHDGQNLFDAATSFAGEWEVDETLGQMIDEGYPGMIVVGIDNGGDERLNEYSPPWPLKSGKLPFDHPIISVGHKYTEFLVTILKPYIDQNYNTLQDKAHTGIGGSSMGGIISFYTALKYQDIFGFALIFSSSFWLYKPTVLRDFMREFITNLRTLPKMFFYHGTKEGSYTYLTTITRELAKKNVPATQYTTLIGKGYKHNEQAWAKIFPLAIRWLVSLP